LPDKSILLPPFLMSSVPKSGTFFLHQILTGIPGLSSDHVAQKRFFSELYPFEFYRDDHMKRLKLLKENEFGVGHVNYSKEYSALLADLGFKHIFIYRDPRDVLVSLAYFIRDKWIEHPLHEDFNHLYLTSRDRILALLTPIEGKWLGFYKFFQPYYDWLGDKSTFHISYESLTGSEEEKRRVLGSLAEYLFHPQELPIPKEELVNRMLQNIRPTEARTFRKGTRGEWRNEFDEEIKAKFKSHAGHMLINLGYEKDDNW
jgi:sulfotransferase 6B1